MNVLEEYTIQGYVYVDTSDAHYAFKLVKDLTNTVAVPTDIIAVRVVDSVTLKSNKKCRVTIELNIEADTKGEAIKIARSEYKLPAQVNLIF